MASIIKITGTVAQEYRVTLGVTTDVPQPYKWHWKKNGALIGGAGSAPSYTTPELRREDLSNKYSVIIYGRNGAQEEAPEIGLWGTHK